MKDIKTDQENFWAGDFGNQYINRNQSDELLAANIKMFSDVFSRMDKVNSITEYGCNVGMNLQALKILLPGCSLRGVEINKAAVNLLREQQPNVEVVHKSILDPDEARVDLTFTKGVLIHINPNELKRVYENLYCNTSRYVLIAEYYNPTPVALKYRGHENMLFKRDFAQEIMELYPDLNLLDYGFCYHKDKNFPQDDITWFLLKKNA
jgi:pseudaminic acid biosynthesis-associated methylase